MQVHQLVLLRYARLLGRSSGVSSSAASAGDHSLLLVDRCCLWTHSLMHARLAPLCAGARRSTHSKNQNKRNEKKRCFEALEINQRRCVRLRECVPPLLKCLRALAQQLPAGLLSIDTGAPSTAAPRALSHTSQASHASSPHALLESLSNQLADPRLVCEMLSGAADGEAGGRGTGPGGALVVVALPGQRQDLVVRMYYGLIEECAKHAFPVTSSPGLRRQSAWSCSCASLYASVDQSLLKDLNVAHTYTDRQTETDRQTDRQTEKQTQKQTQIFKPGSGPGRWPGS